MDQRQILHQLVSHALEPEFVTVYGLCVLVAVMIAGSTHSVSHVVARYRHARLRPWVRRQRRLVPRAPRGDQSGPALGSPSTATPVTAGFTITRPQTHDATPSGVPVSASRQGPRAATPRPVAPVDPAPPHGRHDATHPRRVAPAPAERGQDSTTPAPLGSLVRVAGSTGSDTVSPPCPWTLPSDADAGSVSAGGAGPRGSAAVAHPGPVSPYADRAPVEPRGASAARQTTRSAPGALSAPGGGRHVR